MTETLDFLTLASADDAFLEEVMRRGEAPDMDAIAGWEFRGFNSLDLTTLLGFRKFKKGFFEEAGQLHGYNVKVRQGGLIDPWEDVTKRGEPVRHGYYDVYPVRAAEIDNLYPRALLLNYASKKNPIYDPSRVLRDYLVQAEPGNPDLLLGKAYVALGRRRIFVSYFTLERSNRGAA